MSIIIGLTGPTGSGKSTASKTAEKFGFKVIDCDKAARAATEKGTEGLKALIKVFGTDILTSDGSLDRRALAQRAFSSKENTQLLNETLLPCIVRLIEPQLKDKNVLLDAPTLFESGMNRVCGATVAVLADTEVRAERIKRRDGIDDSAAGLRINAGKPDSFYFENADYIIYNNGEEKAFISEFEKIISDITGKI